MEVKIGVQHAARELVLEVVDSAEDVERAVEAALSGSATVLSLQDEKGRKIIVPSDRLAYVEIGEPSVRRVGFGAV
ncbi:DUF3107 domain-containing protein [Streptomycetaceae bacterium NBC_01309]